MKKVTAFIASHQKRATYGAVREFEEHLRSYADLDMDFEYVFLKDYRLENCRGCCLCFQKGEEFCPLKDDRDILLQKIYDSDGVIFATPTYAFQVAAPMKTLFDRLSFILHRPRFFEKTCTSIVTEGIYGGKGVLKYLDKLVTAGLGFNVAEGCVLHALQPITDSAREKITRKTKKAAARFHKELMRPESPAPSLFGLMVYRLSRTGIKESLGDGDRDFRYYRDLGWFDNDYYYPVSLGPIKKVIGSVFDYLGKQKVKHS